MERLVFVAPTVGEGSHAQGDGRLTLCTSDTSLSFKHHRRGGFRAELSLLSLLLDQYVLIFVLLVGRDLLSL